MHNKFSKELELFKKLGFLNKHNLSEEESLLLPFKYSVRSIILLDNNKIVMVKVSRDNYHSIIGGKIEDGEDLKEAIIRESLEESGYSVSIICPIGYLEYWKKKYKKFDFCFLVKAVGEQQSLSLTNEELEIGHQIEEYDINEAIFILENDIKTMNNPVSERSLIFLNEYKKYLNDMV